VINEIAWNMAGDMFFLTTGNSEKIFLTKLFFFCDQELIVIISIFFHSGTVEVLAYPSLKPVYTLMAHTAGCYCIAIDPTGRSATILYLLIISLPQKFGCDHSKFLSFQFFFSVKSHLEISQ